MKIERFRVQRFKGSKVQRFKGSGVQGFRGYNLLRTFQPGTLNGEPLNLGFNNIYEQAEKMSKLHSGLITYLLKGQNSKPNELKKPNEHY